MFNYKSEPALPDPIESKPAQSGQAKQANQPNQTSQANQANQPNKPNKLKVRPPVLPLLRPDLNDETIPLAGTSGPVPPAKDEAEQAAGFVDDFEEREKERISDERKKRLRNLSMKINNVEELEKTPAYLRRNVPLEEDRDSSDQEVSRFTLNEVSKDGDESGLRKNNSFLHDNVD